MEFKYVHTMIRVKDLEKSLHFYVDLMGMHITSQKQMSDFSLTFLADKSGATELELTYNFGQEEPYTHGSGYGHMAFYVDDLEGAREMFAKEGCAVGPFKGLDPSRPNYFFVDDPDGYKVEVIRG